MHRRILAAWLPTLPTDRLGRTCSPGATSDASFDRPRVVCGGQHGRLVVVAVDAAAVRDGLAPGMALADARAIEPGLQAFPADPAADAAALAGLADWAGRYTPWAATCGAPTEGEGGLLLDITGCAHLFGGEAGLVRDLVRRLAGFGCGVRVAVADTPGAAWAVARVGPGHGPGGGALGAALIRPDGTAAALAPLPIAGLRLDAGTVAMLVGLGLRRIADLRALPRSALAARFGPDALRRLDQAYGAAAEPITPRRPPPAHAARMTLAEPIGRREGVAAGLDQLLARLCGDLEQARQGARRLELALYRVDGAVLRLAVGTHRPSRRPAHLARLFAEELDGIDAGFGIETLVLSATAVQPLGAVQIPLDDPALHVGVPAAGDAALADLVDLVDRLSNRLGGGAVRRPVPRESHLPERAVAWAAPLAPPSAAAPRTWPADRCRPLRLFAVPRPVAATAPVPDDPPVLFRWHGRVHRVVRADGPERIAPEWWCDPPGTSWRDYYRVEDTAGRRFWLYRAGPHDAARPPAWYLHGLFA